MEIPILNDLVVILGLSVIVILLFARLKVPTIIGFLITGILAGPGVLSIVQKSHEVEILAEIGVILLMFVIGIEFSVKSLAAIKKIVFIGGAVQVFGAIGLTALALQLFDFTWPQAVFLGFLMSLSSTAIVLKLLQDRGDINAPHGRIALGILIFQDIIVVPMMLFTPLLAGQADNVAYELLILALKGVFVVVFVLVSARYIVPALMYRVAKTKSKELFILAITVICFAVAWLTSSLGLSLALGAFLAGVIISESEYNHQATSNILPFREIFASIFFVSIGMLLDVEFLLQHIVPILIMICITVLLKAGVAGAAALVLRYPPRIIIMVALALFQVGEFAFILSKFGIDYGLLSDESYQYFLSVSILTMALTPFVINSSPQICNLLVKTPIPEPLINRVREAASPEPTPEERRDYNDHLVIIGYGINGKNVARAAKQADIPYVIVELNPDTVKREREAGEPIVYGDAVQGAILTHLFVHKARVAVVAISDPEATRRIIVNIRELSSHVHIIIRTRFIGEMDELFGLGADEVIPEEFETSIEIFTRVLYRYLVPHRDIEDFVRHIRSDNYEMLRPLAQGSNSQRQSAIDVPEIETAAVIAEKPGGKVVGKSVMESEIRKNFKINLLAIKRDREYIIEIRSDTVIRQHDVLYVFGKHDDIVQFEKAISI